MQSEPGGARSGGVLRDPPQAGRRESGANSALCGEFPQGRFIRPEDERKIGLPQSAALWEADPAAPKFIVTKRGMGYLFGG